MNMIDSKVMKYVPKKLHEHVIACDRFENFSGGGYTYNVLFDYEKCDGEETTIFADGVEGLRWCCKAVLNGERGVIYG